MSGRISGRCLRGRRAVGRGRVLRFANDKLPSVDGTNGGTFVPLGMPATSAAQGGNIVLIAEDEPIIRMLLKSLLKRHGLNVVAAVDGQEAWEIYEQRAEEIAVVITDLNMPRLDGPGLVRRIAEHPRHPGIIVTSGLPEMIEEVRRVWHDDIVIMPKPYDAHDLAAALERVRFAGAHI